MKEFLKKIIRLVQIPFVITDYVKFNSYGNKRFINRICDFYPQIKDKTFKTGFDRHYVYHTSWAARKLAEIKPDKHIDISSSLYFAGIVSAFIPIDFYDYRPADIKLNGLTSNKGDLMELPFQDSSVKSLSCMHTVEHIGLGRYGDKIDPDGDLKAINELIRVLAPGGSLLFVVPVGKPKIEFNAHRIYSLDQIKKHFSNLELMEFALIPENEDGVVVNASSGRVSEENYGCGCFWFKKIV